MTDRADFDKIELYLIRVLKTLITERSVSRAAMRLQSTQPAVSAQLKKLRALPGDPLLVRAGNNMAPTETALRLLGPAMRLLHDADRLFGARKRASAASTRRRAARPSASPRATTWIRCSCRRWWRRSSASRPRSCWS